MPPSPSLWWSAIGLEPSHLSLFSPTHIIQSAVKRGWPMAILLAIRHFIIKVIVLAWKLAAPEVIVRRIVALVILQFSLEAILPLAKSVFFTMTGNFTVQTGDSAEAIAMREKVTNATCYEEWRDASRALESLTRPVDKDKLIESDRFQRMKDKTELYRRLVRESNTNELMYRLRGELLRKHWGLGEGDDAMTRDNPHYRRHLAEYMETVCDALALIAKGSSISGDTLDAIHIAEGDLNRKINSLRARADFFSETLHSFGRSALLLSGGARLGLLHLGVVRCLRDQGLLPRVISGASAGSIVAVMLGAYKDEELDERLFNPININLRFFAVIGEDQRGVDAVKKFSRNTSQLVRSLLLTLPPPLPELAVSMAQVLPVWFSQGTLLDVRVLAAAVRDATGDLTFKEAFDRTGRIISITISPTGERDFPMLLNYLTTPNILLWSASVASCAIPGVFAPVELLAKDHEGNIVPYYPEGRKWSDGSVENDLPMERLAELFNVNNFIVSQVNPHARLLAPMSIKKGPSSGATTGYNGHGIFTFVRDAFDTGIRVVVDFCRDETRSAIKHWAAAMLVSHSIAPRILAPVKTVGKSLIPILTQKYTGDITIMPELTFKGLFNILANPSAEDYLKDLDQGERNVWPHISRLRLHCAIEILLDDCRQTCRRQLAKLEEKLLHSPTVTNNIKGYSPNIATASVLTLNELDVAAPGIAMSSAPRNNNNGKFSTAGGGDSIPPTRSQRGSSIVDSPTRQRPQLRRDSSLSSGIAMAFDRPVLGRQSSLRPNTSFMNLNDKLKQRVQSFAIGLNDMADEEVMEGHDAG